MSLASKRARFSVPFFLSVCSKKNNIYYRQHDGTVCGKEEYPSMELQKGQQFAGQLLRRHRRLQGAWWRLWGLGGLSWLLEGLAAGSLLLMQNAMPSALLGEYTLVWRLVQLCLGIPLWAVWHLLCWDVQAQCTLAAGMDVPQKAIQSRRRLLALSLQNTLLRVGLLLPVFFCLGGAGWLAQTSTRYAEGIGWLLGAAQLIAAGIILLIVWGYVQMGLWCVPFVWFAQPDLPLWRVPLAALRMMRGQHKQLLLLLLWHGVQCLPLVTLPWVLPRAAVAVTVFCNIQVQPLREQPLQ